MSYLISDAQLRLANRLGENAAPSVATEATKRRLWFIEGIQEILKKRPFWFTQTIFTDATEANVPNYTLPTNCRTEFMVYVDGYKYEKITPEDIDEHRTALSPVQMLSSSFKYAYYKIGDDLFLIPTPTTAPTAQSVTSITSSATTCTVTLTAHGYATNDWVTIAGANEAAYNGKFQITLLTADTFKYTSNSTPSATPATGTITATKDNIEIWGYEEPTLPTTDASGIVIPDKYISGIVSYAEARFWSSAHKRGKAADAFTEFENVIEDMIKEDTRRSFLSGQWRLWER